MLFSLGTYHTGSNLEKIRELHGIELMYEHANKMVEAKKG